MSGINRAMLEEYDPTKELYFKQIFRSFQKLSVLQQMIIRCTIDKLSKCDMATEQECPYVTLSDLAQYGKAASDYSYNDLEEATVDLLRRSFTVQDLKAAIVIPWVQAVNFDAKKHRVILIFSDKVVPFLDRLKGKFE